VSCCSGIKSPLIFIYKVFKYNFFIFIFVFVLFCFFIMASAKLVYIRAEGIEIIKPLLGYPPPLASIANSQCNSKCQCQCNSNSPAIASAIAIAPCNSHCNSNSRGNGNDWVLICSQIRIKLRAKVGAGQLETKICFM